MDGQLVPVCCPEDSSSELILLVQRWRQEVAELRAEVQGLRRENLELRQQVGYWKSRHRDALGRAMSPALVAEKVGARKTGADSPGHRAGP